MHRKIGAFIHRKIGAGLYASEDRGGTFMHRKIGADRPCFQSRLACIILQNRLAISQHVFV